MSDTKRISPAEALAAAIAEYGPPMAEYYDAVEALRTLDAECDRLRAALAQIATTTTSMPPAFGKHAEWYRRIAWGCIGIAARGALATDARITQGDDRWHRLTNS